MGMSGNATGPPRGGAGEAAERLVFERLRAALPADYRLYSNVAWIGRTADHRGLRDGEADLVIAHPERGILVLEVKAVAIPASGAGCDTRGGTACREDARVTSPQNAIA